MQESRARSARARKEAEVDRLAEQLAKARAAILVDYRGLTVGLANRLRRRAAQEGVEYRVVKNTLTERAAARLGHEDLREMLAGPTALALGFADPVAPAKLILSFMQENRVLAFKGGILEGRLVGPDAIRQLAELPARDVLLAWLCATVNAPLSRLVSALNAPLTGLVLALEAVRRQRESAAR